MRQLPKNFLLSFKIIQSAQAEKQTARGGLGGKSQRDFPPGDWGDFPPTSGLGIYRGIACKLT